jgi:hypothetical protein
MNWEKIRKQVVMAYCSYYFGISLEGLMNITTHLGQETGMSAVDIRTEHLLNTHQVKKFRSYGFLG